MNTPSWSSAQNRNRPMNTGQTEQGFVTSQGNVFSFPNDACCRNPGGPGCACAENELFETNELGGQVAETRDDDAASDCAMQDRRDEYYGGEGPGGLVEGFGRIGVAGTAAQNGTNTAEQTRRTGRGLENGDPTTPASEDGLNESEMGDEGDAKKRRKVPNSCTNCKRSHLSCDTVRPCLRCARKGLVCVDSVPKIPAPRGQGPKAREKARLAELRKSRSGFECTMDDEAPASPASSLGPGPSRKVSRVSSSTPSTSDPAPALQVSGVIRPSVTKLARSRPPAPLSRPPSFPVNPNYALSTSSYSNSPHPNSPYSNSPHPHSPHLNTFGTLNLNHFQPSPISPPFQTFPNFPTLDPTANFDIDEALSSLAGTDFLDPPVPLASLPDPIGFDIEDLGNSRFVDQLVFGGTAEEYQDEVADGSVGRKTGKGSVASFRSAGRKGVDDGFTAEERYFLTLAGDHPATNNELSSLLLLKSTQHQPFSYPPSYAKLLRYIDSFPPSPRDRVRSAIEKLWTCLEEREKDAGRSEAHLDALGLDLDTAFSSTGIPAAVWRRTGELLRSNREFGSLVGQSPEKLAGKPVHELWNPESAANYFATFAGIATDPLQKAFLLPCSLKNGAGWLECTASFTVHREPWSGVPCAIVGNFLPLRPPSLESVLEARMEAFRIKEEEGVEEVRRLLGRGVKRGLSGMLGGLQGVEQPPMDELGLLGMDGQQGVDEFSEFVDGMAF